MTYIKKYGLRLIYTIILIIILIGILTIFYYYDLINTSTYNVLKLIILLISIFLNSFILGKNVKEKGYLEGIKFGLIIIILLLIPTIIMKQLNIKLIIYYSMIISTSILGSIMGINKKKISKN